MWIERVLLQTRPGDVTVVSKEDPFGASAPTMGPALYLQLHFLLFKWEHAADQRLAMLRWSRCVLSNKRGWFVWVSCCDRLQRSPPNEAKDSVDSLRVHFTYNKHNNLGFVVAPACLVLWKSLVGVSAPVNVGFFKNILFSARCSVFLLFSCQPCLVK